LPWRAQQAAADLLGGFLVAAVTLEALFHEWKRMQMVLPFTSSMIWA
jgi:hypothetical protein